MTKLTFTPEEIKKLKGCKFFGASRYFSELDGTGDP
jgi:hypothetical protein